ncbi:MAG: ABC-2 transporter permease [Lachnospiraceae bacterium]
MIKALKFVRLDFITVKPYLTLKNLIIFLIVPIILILSSDVGASVISMFMMFAALYVGYPFAVGEKSDIDALYTTLSIGRGTVVLGRYLYALVFNISAVVFACIYLFVVFTIMQRNFDILESLVVALVSFIIFSIIQAIQLPIYFKLGYAKAKMLAYLPFIGFFVVIYAFTKLVSTSYMSQIAAFINWVAANSFITAAVGIIIWLGIMVISCMVSIALYKKQDF